MPGTPRIGPYTFQAMTGEVPAWRQQVLTRERPGRDGYTYVRLGKRSRPFQLRTRALVADLGAARTLAANYARLCGRFVVLETPDGRSFAKIIVLDVTPTVRPIAVATRAGDALVDAAWQLQRAGA